MKKFIAAFAVFALLASSSVCAAEDNSIKITKAQKNGSTVTVSAYVPDYANTEYITIMVCAADENENYDISGNGIVYIDQRTMPVSDSKGIISFSFTTASWTESQKTYMVRIGGSNIEKPAELILNRDAVFFGDVNSDGVIDENDTQLILDYVKDKNTAPLTAEQQVRASVSGGSSITAADASYVSKKIQDSQFKFPAE